MAPFIEVYHYVIASEPSFTKALALQHYYYWYQVHPCWTSQNDSCEKYLPNSVSDWGVWISQERHT